MSYEEIWAVRYGEYSDDSRRDVDIIEVEESYATLEEAIEAYNSFYERNGYPRPDYSQCAPRDDGFALQLYGYCVVAGEVVETYCLASDDGLYYDEPQVEQAGAWRAAAERKFDEIAG